MTLPQSSRVKPSVGSLGSSSRWGDRLKIDYLISPTPEPEEGQDVIAGLSQTPKSLPARYFYDDRGSDLFEQICELPEYYLTRTETAILQRYADEIAQMTGPCELVELGSGSSTKTRLLLDAYQNLAAAPRYLPIDVSAGMLEVSARRLLQDYPTLRVHGLASTYELGLANLEPSPLPSRMICFIGSSLGNLNPAECDRFLDQIAAALQPGEYFLLGLDLHKPKAILEAAYNDSQGVTAAFNLNMLHHLNWRFDGNFEVDRFQHQAIYNETDHQIEMYLHSLVDQEVELRSLNFKTSFQAGEAILSEISRKFDRAQMQHSLNAHGLKVQQIFTDETGWFALFFCQR